MSLSRRPVCRGRRPCRHCPAARRGGEEAQHPRDLGRRHRHLERQPQQPRDDGLPHAQHRPHRPRGSFVHRLLRPAELHRGPGRVSRRQLPGSHGHDEGGAAGGQRGLAEDRRDDRHGAQEPRVRHGAVRQEPSGRPRRPPADDERLRRVLRQPVSPERRGGAGAPRLSRRHEAPQRQDLPRDLRPPWRAQVQGRRQGGADDRKHRAAHEEADGDDRRGDARRRQGLHPAAGEVRHAVLLLVERHADALPHAHEAGEPGEERPGRVQRRDGGARRPRRRPTRGPRRPRHRRRYDRPLLHRQRPPLQHLARRRHHAIPQREELQLGRCLPRAGVRPLAREVSGRHDAQRPRGPRRLAADLRRRGGRRHDQRQARQGRVARRPAVPQLHRRLQPTRPPVGQGAAVAAE